jgi:hypothetical protein
MNCLELASGLIVDRAFCFGAEQGREVLWRGVFNRKELIRAHAGYCISNVHYGVGAAIAQPNGAFADSTCGSHS